LVSGVEAEDEVLGGHFNIGRSVKDVLKWGILTEHHGVLLLAVASVYRDRKVVAPEVLDIDLI